MIKILVLGQTPPPYGGQAIMIKKILEGSYNSIKIYHLRMNFSSEIDAVGKFQFKKIFHLFYLISSVYFFRIYYRINYLYYVPGGPNFIPLYRDILLLNAVRWLFTKTIFHFHAGSTYSMYNKIPKYLRPLFRKAYFYPDIAIRISLYNPNDPEMLFAKKEFIVENGIEDIYDDRLSQKKTGTPKIIFLGLICEAKGICELLQACNTLNKNHEDFKLIVIGKFESKLFEKKIFSIVRDFCLEDKIDFTGILLGNDKLTHFYKGDIFCLPSHFETFGLVFLEAMQFSLPIVTTNVGGIPALVKQGENGFLVKKGDHIELANKLSELLHNKKLRIKMGVQGRKMYLENFTIDKFYIKIENVFLTLNSD